MGHHTFQRRIDGNLWVIGDLVDDEWKISVIDANSEPVKNRRLRIRAIVAALREESRLRAALWSELPEDARAAILEGREGRD